MNSSKVNVNFVQTRTINRIHSFFDFVKNGTKAMPFRFFHQVFVFTLLLSLFPTKSFADTNTRDKDIIVNPSNLAFAAELKEFNEQLSILEKMIVKRPN